MPFPLCRIILWRALAVPPCDLLQWGMALSERAQRFAALHPGRAAFLRKKLALPHPARFSSQQSRVVVTPRAALPSHAYYRKRLLRPAPERRNQPQSSDGHAGVILQGTNFA